MGEANEKLLDSRCCADDVADDESLGGRSPKTVIRRLDSEPNRSTEAEPSPLRFDAMGEGEGEKTKGG
jgi:hypothetical protein